MMIGLLWPFIIGFVISSWLIGCGKKKPKDKTGQPACVKTTKEKDSKEKPEEKKEEKKEEEKKPEEKKPEEEKKEEKPEEKPDVKPEEKKEEEKKPEEKPEEKKEEKPEEKKPEEKKEEKKEESKRDPKKDEKKEEEKKEEEPKPGDPKPHITVEPSMEMTFLADQTEQKKITIKNIHDKKIMFKIKCSDITVYLVNPVFGTLEPGKTVEVTITHNKTPAKEGKLVIVNSVFAGDEKDLAKSFRTGKPTGGLVTVKLIAK